MEFHTQLFYDVALSFLNVPYKWGGNSPSEGLDCSGLVQCILRVYGVDPPGDQTAQALFDHFAEPAHHISQDPQLGALMFYGVGRQAIEHVAICLNRRFMVEASGGGKNTLTIQDAARLDARVKVNLIRFDQKMVGCFMPDYGYLDVEL